MLQAANIIGTGLDTTGLIGAGVGIGVVLGPIVICFICSNDFLKGLLDRINIIIDLALTNPPKPHGFTNYALKACTECVAIVAAAAPAVAALSPTVIAYSCIPIAIGILDVLYYGEAVTYNVLLDCIVNYLTLGDVVNLTPGLLFIAQAQQALGIDITLITSVLDAFIIADINQALLDGTLYGSLSDNFHTITQKSVALVQNNPTEGVQLNWLSKMVETLAERRDWYPGNTFLNRILNYRGVS